ncbi:MAG: TM2 domain-containing protein [Reyranella sp.]|uniref:TM2 domain-containing protein n=1 Tax=Reyranella sp. TaxID=1929291 RepID=UPI001AC37B9A|nr:TM2 domain-containing protein [Reyranella sp.]MBN9091103.1 TM2 domain-containing protein [Reyranella sp.]
MTLPTNAPPPPMSDAARLMQYDAAKKSTGIAYLLWFFLGGLGVHRFYLGQTGTGVAMAIIFVISWITVFIGIGFIGLAAIGIWLIVDAFLIPGITARANMELATRLGRP